MTARRLSPQQRARRRSALWQVRWALRWLAAERRENEFKYRRDKLYRSSAQALGYVSGSIRTAETLGGITAAEANRFQERVSRIWEAEIKRDGLSAINKRFR
jgi:hypothetical protein